MLDPNVAVRVNGVSAVTPTVVIVNEAVVAPPGTVTELGRVTAGLLADRETTSPEAAAALARVTVPVEVKPP